MGLKKKDKLPSQKRVWSFLTLSWQNLLLLECEHIHSRRKISTSLSDHTNTRCPHKTFSLAANSVALPAAAPFFGKTLIYLRERRGGDKISLRLPADGKRDEADNNSTAKAAFCAGWEHTLCQLAFNFPRQDSPQHSKMLFLLFLRPFYHSVPSPCTAAPVARETTVRKAVSPGTAFTPAERCHKTSTPVPANVHSPKQEENSSQRRASKPPSNCWGGTERSATSPTPRTEASLLL